MDMLSVIHQHILLVLVGTDVYKIHWAWVNWIPGTNTCRYICLCADSYYWLDKPKLFNLAQDPSEMNELDITAPKYAKIVELFDQAKKEHQATVEEVPSQFNRLQLLWRPWLQPCCNFPHCTCADPDNILHTRRIEM